MPEGAALRVIQGVRFQKLFQLTRFNPSSGMTKPVLLPIDTIASMSLLQPRGYEIELLVSNDQSGRNLGVALGHLQRNN